MRERTIIDQMSIKKNSDLSTIFFENVKDQFTFFSQNYPLFEKWLSQKVIPNIINGERSIVIEKRYGNLVGFMILKHTQQEKKICTLRVMPEYEHSGLGINLFKLGFEILETEKPLLSVSDNMKSKFEKVFDYFGFKKEKSYYGLYLPFREEISFNGLLNEEVSNPLNSTYNFFFGENQCQKWSKNFSYEPYFYLRDVNKTLRHFPCGEMHYKFKKISTIELNEEDCHFHNNAIRDKLLRPS